MSNIKKLLALVLALTMVLSVSAIAGYTVAPYGDAAKVDEDCEEAVQLLYSLDIMKGDDKGNFNPEATITRAEMAKIIYVILNYGEDDKAINYTGANIFSDVKAGDWYEGYVNYCATIKLVQGRGDGSFAPNAPITTAEAAKMLLTAIGYSAENRGYIGAGWDKQVLSDASIIGLLNDYNYNTTGYAPRQWVAVMVKNALTEAYTYGTIAPVIFNGLLTGTNLPTASYQKMGWKYFGLYAWEGIITANEYADLYSKAALSASNTKINDGEYVFKNWTTDLTEIGEYRRGWAVEDGSKDLVVYATDDGVNTEFSCGGAVTIKKANIDGIKLDSKTVYYQNFESTKAYEADDYVAKGDWLRVVDNDDDGTAEFVFVTEFTMSSVSKITSSKLTLVDVSATEDFATDSELAKGDIVVYTYIDGTYYVEAANEFSGEVDKYAYKNKTLTVDGEDYDQTEIDVVEGLDYYYELEAARKETEYTYYQDFFGNIGLFGRDKADAGELVLLTDAYYANDRYGKIAAVDAYLDGEITDTDVKTSSSTDWDLFIDNTGVSNNNWGKLIEYADDKNANTNVARYTMDDEGVLSLYTAQTWDYDHKGNKDYVVSDYVDIEMGNKDWEAGQTAYTGEYVIRTYDDDGKLVSTTKESVQVQANRDTVFYYVSYANGYPVVETVVGYKNSYDVNKELAGEIYATYAVATNVSSEYGNLDGDDMDEDVYKYWVADVIVIETKYPVFAMNSDVVLGYDVVNKTYDDYAALDVIAADATLDTLQVINKDGDKYNSFKQDGIDVLDFYWNTEDEEGDSYIKSIPADKYGAYDIYVGTLGRTAKLKDYVVTTDNTVLYYDAETVVVYDIYEGTRYNGITTEDDDDETLTLSKGKTYIFFAPDKEVVYAVLVDDVLTMELYDKIAGEGSVTADQAAAIAALREYAAAAAKANRIAADHKDVVAALDKEIENVKAAKTADEIEDIVKNDNEKKEFGTGIQNIWDAAYAAGQVANADAKAELNKIVAAINGATVYVDAEDSITSQVADEVEAIYAAASYDVTVAMGKYNIPNDGHGVEIAEADVTIWYGELVGFAKVTVRIAY